MLKQKIIALLLICSLCGCASRRSEFGPDPYEIAGKILIILPISILLSPLFISQALVEKSKNKKIDNGSTVYRTEEMIISTSFYRLKDEQYSFPSIYIESGDMSYKAFIPVYDNQMQNQKDIESLKIKYQKEFSSLVNYVLAKNIKTSWRAYQYQNNNWLVFDSNCNILGVSNEKEFALLSSDKIDQEMWNVRNLCKNHGGSLIELNSK